MTDPDQRHSQARGNFGHSDPSVPPLPPPQPNFGFVRANISQIHTSSAGSTVQPSVAVSSVAGPSLADDPFQIPPATPSGVNYQFLTGSSISQVQQPSGLNAPLQNPISVVSVDNIPQVQLPANWDTPLQNIMPVVPPVPVFPRRGRGRGRGRLPVGPLHDLSGGQSNPAWNNLHRGHIAQREHTANYQAHLARLKQEQARAEYEEHLRTEELNRQAEIEQEEERRRIQLEEIERNAAIR